MKKLNVSFRYFYFYFAEKCKAGKLRIDFNLRE